VNSQPLSRQQVTRLGCTPSARTGTAITYSSADPLCQRNDDALWASHVCHQPSVLLLADAPDEAVAVRGQLVDGRTKVVDLERNAAQAQLIGHCRGVRHHREGGLARDRRE